MAPPPPKAPAAHLPVLPEQSDSDNSVGTINGPGGSHGTHGTMRPKRRGPRPSLIPGPSKARVSSFGTGMGLLGSGMNTLGTGGSGFQSFGSLGTVAAEAEASLGSKAGSTDGRYKPSAVMVTGITEEDIDERVSILPSRKPNNS